MCTAICYKQYFGRNLDLEYGYREQICITPRNYPLSFRCGKTFKPHYAMIGMATVEGGYPLYYEATNEKGLSMAALDFPDNAYYPPAREGCVNVAPFELIPFILCQCAGAAEAAAKIKSIHLADIHFNETLPQAPLHWIVADEKSCFVVEPTQCGVKVYNNPVGILTNNPPFSYHMQHLAGFQHLSAGDQRLNFESLELPFYGGGMGAIGLPGDFSSPSRFVKAAFVTLHSHSGPTEEDNVTQFFHLLQTVAMPRGAIRVHGGQDEITRYSSCCNTRTRTYYYTTYGNSRIQAVSMGQENMDMDALSLYGLDIRQDIHYHN